MKGLKRRSPKTANLTMVYIDSDTIPTKGQKAIGDRESEYVEIYTDPFLFKSK